MATELKISRAILYRWAALDEGFKEDIEKARKARAFYMNDKCLEILEETKQKSQVPVNKFKFMGYAKLAAMDSPKEFGEKKAEEAAVASGPVVIQINTGIDRTPLTKDDIEISVTKKKEDE
jgi:hypothetical protein